VPRWSLIESETERRSERAMDSDYLLSLSFVA
jgi:hypothetical protein